MTPVAAAAAVLRPAVAGGRFCGRISTSIASLRTRGSRDRLDEVARGFARGGSSRGICYGKSGALSGNVLRDSRISRELRVQARVFATTPVGRKEKEAGMPAPARNRKPEGEEEEHHDEQTELLPEDEFGRSEKATRAAHVNLRARLNKDGAAGGTKPGFGEIVRLLKIARPEAKWLGGWVLRCGSGGVNADGNSGLCFAPLLVSHHHVYPVRLPDISESWKCIS